MSVVRAVVRSVGNPVGRSVGGVGNSPGGEPLTFDQTDLKFDSGENTFDQTVTKEAPE